MKKIFALSQKDGRPMYLQIMEQIKQLVAQGDWAQGEKVPSIRELAVATSVSVITVKRAYQELEREGVLVTQQGIGSFVANNENLNDLIIHNEIDKHLKQALSHAGNYGISVTDLKKRLQQLSEQKESDNE
ncbi:GntR family transcriptional regulator [Marinicella gelatinilytica]|uniref:GntR family transcriptional regulator n=1 Tax=Marinicella gelatinilytica TaxID=2996017 RepID=UPI002260DD8B|nr:GntR family transcriptional regulator [Marinicella gelatinilytica]MCX7544186.1 GntR family transcriptional regulator [Marinicella gelatinilytica]